jgi:type VI secretion system secreted protein VgrG
MAPKQDERLLSIKTALGPDVLSVRSISVRDQLSRMFEIEAQLSSVNADVDFDQVIGRNATLRLDIGQNDKRYFHGLINRLVQVANEGGYAHYRATIVPKLWILTRTSDCRIFQAKTVPEIVQQIFKDYGLDDYKLKLSSVYRKWEYCVQYRETAFNFVSRLMEQEGIYYYFEHEDGKHTIILADSINAHKPVTNYADVPFYELEKGASGREAVTSWVVEKEVQPVTCALNDFDFKKPKTSLLASSKIPRQYGEAKHEIYDYPGEYVENNEGDSLADVRINELQTQYETLHGQTTARGLATGATFKLKNHPRKDQNREYLITSLNLEADAGEFATTGGAAGQAGEFFGCNFTAIQKSQQFRPARLTPKPIVQGPQTAIVVGPGGEEIYTDEHARVKLHFHWDRHDKSDENSSCWVRVSQHWAGKQWGSIHIPRINQEVIVEFLEGDPDRPIITGRVYNADQVPPYGLPGNKTQSGIKSRSSKGGSTANFNEIRFEDKKGSEQVYVHAEKNQDNVVENDETTDVGHDRTEKVGHDEKITIGNDRTEKVGNNEDITIGVNRTEKVGSNENISIGVNRTEKVGSNENITIGANRTENVAANETISVGANRTRNVGANETITVAAMRTHTVGANEAITVGAAQEVTVGAAQTITVGADQATTVGANQTNNIGADQSDSVGGNRTTAVSGEDALTVGKKLSITATDEITITTGDASIHMKKDGTIQIKGKDISIEGSGAINVKASKDITMKGQKILEN